MEEWYVSDSEPESERGEERTRSEIKDWLVRLESRGTLDLDCYVAARTHRKRRKRKKVEREADEVSETASEMRNTVSLTASTECRDTRRPSLSAYDFDDDFPALLGKDDLQKRKKLEPSEPKPIARISNTIQVVQREEVDCHHNGCCNGKPPLTEEDHPFSLDFDDSEFDSPGDETSLFSKISVIETFLNQDGIA